MADTEAGWVAAELREEFPGLALRYLVLERGSGRSPRAVKDRLRTLAARFGGGQVINLRHQTIPWAYRVFFRHIGLDPDEQRTPVEEVVLERMRAGGFRSRNLLDDALTIAIMETGVAVSALDADRVEGELGLRPAERGERFGEGEYASDIPTGRLLVADSAGPVGVLFGAIAPGRGVSSDTTRMTLLAVQVAGVPDIHVEEALWTVADIIGEA